MEVFVLARVRVFAITAAIGVRAVQDLERLEHFLWLTREDGPLLLMLALSFFR